MYTSYLTMGQLANLLLNCNTKGQIMEKLDQSRYVEGVFDEKDFHSVKEEIKRLRSEHKVNGKNLLRDISLDGAGGEIEKQLMKRFGEIGGEELVELFKFYLESKNEYWAAKKYQYFLNNIEKIHERFISGGSLNFTERQTTDYSRIQQYIS